MNDTVGTLVTNAFEDMQTKIGLILGTGCNAAYIEKIDRIKKFTPSDKGTNSTHARAHSLAHTASRTRMRASTSNPHDHQH